VPDREITVSVYDRQMCGQGELGAYLSLTANRRWMNLTDVSTAEFNIPSDLDLRQQLAAPGSRAVVRVDGQHFVGGLISGDNGSVFGSQPVTFRVEDDFSFLRYLLGYPVPTAGLSDQTVKRWKTRGPAETVAKRMIAANADRLGIPVVIAPDQGRGKTVDVMVRFLPLADKLLPALLAAGIGLSVEFVEGVGLRVDVYEPASYPVPLDVASEVIVNGDYSRSIPTCTRAIVGGGGEGTKRRFALLVDEAREAEWGFVREVFVDARDAASDYESAQDTTEQAAKDAIDRRSDVEKARTDLRLAKTELADTPGNQSLEDAVDAAQKDYDDAVKARTAAEAALVTARAAEDEEHDAYLDTLAERGQDALDDGAAKTSATVELVETDDFAYPAYDVGSRVVLDLNADQPINDRITEVTLDHQPGAWPSFKPAVGDRSDSSDQRMARALARLAAGARDQKVR